MLSRLLPATDKAGQQGTAMFFLAETTDVPYNTVSWETDAHVLLGKVQSWKSTCLEEALLTTKHTADCLRTT